MSTPKKDRPFQVLIMGHGGPVWAAGGMGRNASDALERMMAAENPGLGVFTDPLMIQSKGANVAWFDVPLKDPHGCVRWLCVPSIVEDRNLISTAQYNELATKAGESPAGWRDPEDNGVIHFAREIVGDHAPVIFQLHGGDTTGTDPVRCSYCVLPAEYVGDGKDGDFYCEAHKAKAPGGITRME